MVWQGPRLGFVAETGRLVAMETPRVRFSCLLAFAPSYFSFLCCLLFLFFQHPGMFIFVEWVRAVCARLGGKKGVVCARTVRARLGGKVVVVVVEAPTY